MRKWNLTVLSLCLAFALLWCGALAETVEIAPESESGDLILDEQVLDALPPIEPTNELELSLEANSLLTPGEMAESVPASNSGEASLVTNDSDEFEIEGTVLKSYKGEGGPVIVPAGITVIGNAAFYASDITSVTLPSSVISIRGDAFALCSSMTNITLNSGLINIGSDAFCASGLTSVNIPSSVIIIENGAFADCKALSIAGIGNGVSKIGESAFQGCTNLGSIDIPGSVINVEQWAFSGCANLGSVTVNEGVQYIGDSAFDNCTSLTTVSLPESLSSLGNGAFANCSSLRSFTIPGGLKAIPINAFNRCISLSEVTIPDNVTDIERYAFSDCYQLNGVNADGKVVLSDTIKYIGKEAFNHCISITDLSIGKGIQSIEALAFGDCSRLKNVDIDDHEASILNSVFYGIDTSPDFTLNCDSGLASWVIEQHDANENFTYTIHHHPEKVDAVKPTTETEGYTAGEQCTWCYEWLTPREIIPKLPKSVTLNKSGTVKLVMKKTLQLTATLHDSDSASELTWSSSNNNVAKVSNKGKVTAISKGTATIKVKTSNKKTAKVKINVVAPKPTKVTITNGSKATLKVGKTLQLKTKLTPSIAESTLTWKSSNSKVAKVDSKGLVTAVSAGKANITVTTANKKKAIIKITVK